MLPVAAAFAGCNLTRHCNFKAYTKNARATTTSDMIAEIGAAFEDLFVVEEE